MNDVSWCCLADLYIKSQVDYDDDDAKRYRAEYVNKLCERDR